MADYEDSEPGPSKNRAVRSSTSSSSFSLRRRVPAANPPPAAPPPDLPIPRPPARSDTPPVVLEEEMAHAAGQEDLDEFRPHPYATHSSLHTFQRQTASPQLAAVAGYSQSRLAAASPPSNSTFNDNLSDSPPRSLLPRTSQHPPPVSQEIVPDRLLLSPPETKSPTSQTRPSSRRVLTRALELAREAVRLDSTNDDPRGAIKAYGQSVSLLNEVMERVMKGEDTGEHRRKNGRRRSIVAQEEEVRRLKSIHDTYADRMNILSLIYAIPASPNPPSSAHSSRSDSPTSEPSRDAKKGSPGDGTSNRQSSADRRELVDGDEALMGRISQNSSKDNTLEAQTSIRLSSVPLSSRANANGAISRLRSSSNLPPQLPVPSASPPKAPGDSIASKSPTSPIFPQHVENGSKQSFGHKRMGSGSRVEALRGEALASAPSSAQQSELDAELRRGQSGHRYGSQESPPLPALPPEATLEDDIPSPTPRVIASSMASQMSASPPRTQSPAGATRPRGGSTLSVKSEASTSKSSQATLINESPQLGTISQRRNKSSTSSTLNEVVSADSPTDSIMISKRFTSSAVPAGPMGSLVGRNRAASQPVRSSGAVTPISTSGLSTSSQHMSVPAPRKTSSFRQSPQPQLPPSAFLSSYPPATAHGPTLTLIPPPPILPGQLPITPTSPLPSLPPTDPLRKPYHLMNLLRHTMVSKSGGYITRRLHVPYEVWSQGGAKLTNLIEKVRVIEVLCHALREVQNASVDFCGPMGVANGMGLGVGSVSKKEGEQWMAKLEEFLLVCDNVVGSFGKKLGVGEGFVVKKSSGMTSWGGKFARQLDKLTNGKNLDSPMTYVQGLTDLFQLSQLLDEHTMALNSQPMAPSYGALAPDLCMAIELKLKRASEFFASVVLTFIIRDLSALLDKYAKKGEKWLAE